MKLAPHYLKRYKDITLLLMKYGQPAKTSRFNSDEDTPNPEDSDKVDQNARDLPDDLERLGPTFIKLGQLLSSRPDLLPPGYLKALSRLQDDVKPFPFEQVQEIVEAELGVRIKKAFGSFEPVPLAAASLGQVHRASLHNGRPVVVKVQRPGIVKQIEGDFAALHEIAKFLHHHTRAGQRYQVESVLEEFENTLAHELDYRREAANLVTLGKNLARFERLRVPAPIDDYCARKILTMDYIEGTKITELPPLARLDIEGGALAEELFRAYLQQILVDGIFHADPHPGNILLTTDARIALIDLGMVGHTTPGMQENLLKLLLAVSEGESDQAADVAVRMSQSTPRFDEMHFRRSIGQLVAEQRNSKLSDIDVGRVVLEVNRIAAETGLYVPAELSLLGKTLLQLDEVGRTLEPEFDPNESVRRNASAILNQRIKSVFTEGKVYSSMLEAKEFLGALPMRLNKILDTLGNAEVNVTVKPSETEFLVDSARKVANRITTGLVLAALIVGAALLMRVETRFLIFGYPGFAMICFLGAATCGFGLVINILWQDQKSKRQSRRKSQNAG
jgi:predicted unusual protein kinase regulating ubiquinone biosynthesis (AarF/ABC1/UbiB family)